MRDDLKERSKAFAIRVLRMVDALPRTPAGRAIANQVTRSATSVGANYRAARRARSPKEFVAKIGVVVEEADETEYWLELILETGMLPEDKIAPLLAEATELTKIFATSRRTARDKLK